jgi:hypothetical protein
MNATVTSIHGPEDLEQAFPPNTEALNEEFVKEKCPVARRLLRAEVTSNWALVMSVRWMRTRLQS